MKTKLLFAFGLVFMLFVACSDNEDDDTPIVCPNVSPYISKVYDFCPAVGQFTNKAPEYKDGDTKEDIIAKVEGYLVGEDNKGLVSLGGYGGYIVFGFDHAVENVAGKRDIRIMGNAFASNPDVSNGGSSEPGIIMVSSDANANGLPDDEWYEIAGSEYNKPASIKNYEITYHRPEEGAGDIYWKDNQGKEGYKTKNTVHTQNYYPNWVTTDSITFKGTLLADNGKDESEEGAHWVLYPYGYGYADNVTDTEDDSAFDISWAVDSDGQKVELKSINFVKIYTGVNQEVGRLGEVSTEISGAYDLHSMGESIDSVK